ncbi:hypothetical protein PTKIN_Ptkin14bG0017700 [Pterospermum kingtungense]
MVVSYCDVDAGIKSYPKTDSWKEGTDCCSWDGVTWLYGSIPSNSSLFLLPHLRKLNLTSNDFNAFEMSFKFGEFSSLVYLNLSTSNFVGQVPSQVSHLSKLASLDLSRNYA